jgi:pimeloyl-ACP methyl ester carboxylesterase
MSEISMKRLELAVNGYSIPATVFGEGHQCLVCVNAAQQTMSAQRALVRPFTRAGYRLVLFDFPNQGSGPTVDNTLGLLEQAEITHEVIRQVALGQPVDMFGASWGSLVAAASAALYPSSVNRLILAGFQARMQPRLQAICRAGLELLEGGTARSEGADFVIREFGKALPEAIRIAMRKQFASFTDAQIRQSHAQTVFIAAGTDLRDLVDLRRIDASVLVINGAEDPLLDVNDYATMAGCFRHAELSIIEGLGHFVHIERPSLIDLYLEFVLRHSDVAKIA